VTLRREHVGVSSVSKPGRLHKQHLFSLGHGLQLHSFIIVDSHSKWPEVIGPMKTTTGEATANAMRNIFARYGKIPFESAEYKEFLKQNGIQRILVSPYHPSSNGLAERFVQTFKHSLDSSASDPSCTLQQRVQNFIL